VKTKSKEKTKKGKDDEKTAKGKEVDTNWPNPSISS
jgi:hypothetical protein